MAEGTMQRISAEPQPLNAAPGVANALPPLIAAVARHEDLLLKLITLAATPLIVLIFIVKYLPDYAQVNRIYPIILSDYNLYWKMMYEIGPFRPRFASNYLVYYVAKAIEAVIGIPGDPRIHPLRLSASVVTTVSLWLIAAPVLANRDRLWNWRIFYTALLIITMISLYQYLPFDFPSLVFVSLALVLLIQKRTVLTLIVLLICGLFRENNVHIAWFAVSMLLIPELSVGIVWTAIYVVAAVAEWWVLRRIIFDSGGNDVWYVIRINLASLTAYTVVALILCLAALVFVVVAARWGRAARRHPLDTFFLIQVLMVPVWLVFYLANGGNWSEFRIQLTTLLPLVYAVALRPQPVAAFTGEQDARAAAAGAGSGAKSVV
jgi:hypothetical protein